jgi:DNA-binding transcriptional ArsR family regulator
MAVARGKRRVAAAKPEVWFTSTESFAKVLSAGNRDLLRLIIEKAPASLDELARLSGNAKSNLSRTLRTMEGYGLVRFERQAGPHHAKGDPRPRRTGLAARALAEGRLIDQSAGFRVFLGPYLRLSPPRSRSVPSAESTPALLLEAVVSMPPKEMRMRPFEGSMGCTGDTVLVDQCPHTFLIVHSP